MIPNFTLTIEPVNICNLACSYCLREDAHLHKDPAAYLSVDLLRSVLRDAKQVCGADEVSIAGGEPTLHPKFGDLLGAIHDEGYQFGLVTNGWHFGRVRAALLKHREALTLIGFSIDGADEATHDRIRGKGSFRRLMAAVADCHACGLPFSFKVVLHRDNTRRIETLCLFAARLGALGITFAHFLATGPQAERDLSLSQAERDEAEREIGAMRRVLKMNVACAVGFANTDPAPPCRVLALKECNIDYAGRMSVCCNLSGFRGGVPDRDIVADLNKVGFAAAWGLVTEQVGLQNAARHAALANLDSRKDFHVTSPCELCLTHFDKNPWLPKSPAAEARP